ncbi:hypothetical protein VPH35_043333 [Triticum aestivum]
MDDMDIGAICDEGSSASALSRTRTPEPREDAYLIVIPYAHIFDLMLKALKFPPASYYHKICPGGKNRVKVTFNSSLQLIDGLLVPTSISGAILHAYEDAEDSAAIAAIRDYHYTHVKRLENEVKHLVRWLVAANKTIKKLRKGRYYAVRYMSSYSIQMQNTTTARHLKGQDNTKGAVKSSLASIEKLTQRLRYIGTKSEQRLETTKDSFW